MVCPTNYECLNTEVDMYLCKFKHSYMHGIFQIALEINYGDNKYVLQN